MNKHKVLKQILIKEKVNTKADLQRQINALDAQVSSLQLNRLKNWEQSQKKRTLSKNEQSRTTFADDASNLKNLENPMIHLLVDGKQSEKFSPHGGIKAAHKHLVSLWRRM